MVRWPAFLILLAGACSSTSTNPGGSGGAAGSGGGSGGTGAVSAGGTGATSSGGASGGGTGGVTTSGGAAGMGATSGMGGAGAAGGSGIGATGGTGAGGALDGGSADSGTATGGSGGCLATDLPTGNCADLDPTGACGGPIDNCCVGDLLYLCPCAVKKEWSLPAPSGDCCPASGTSISPNTACTTAPGVICCYSKTAYSCVNGSWQQYQGAFTCSP